MVKAHTPINWENKPSANTPINETNLNKMDSTIGILDDRIIAQDTSKLDKSTANTMVKSISFDESTGVFTITLLNGSTTTIDTKLEKIAVNFSYDAETQQIILNLIDGTKQYIDVSELITQYEFADSDTIGWEVATDGKVKAKVLDGSITENMLQPNFLADVKVESAKAESNAILSQSYAKGNTGTRDEEDTDNAMYYANQSKETADSLKNMKEDLSNALTKSNIANNLTTTEEGMVLDARQGKALNDKIDIVGTFRRLGSVSLNNGATSKVEEEITGKALLLEMTFGIYNQTVVASTLSRHINKFLVGPTDYVYPQIQCHYNRVTNGTELDILVEFDMLGQTLKTTTNITDSTTLMNLTSGSHRATLYEMI